MLSTKESITHIVANTSPVTYQVIAYVAQLVRRKTQCFTGCMVVEASTQRDADTL